MKKLLLISNSTMAGQPYLEYPVPFIKNFLGDTPLRLVFIPFAGVTFSFDDYEAKVAPRFQALGHTLTSIHHFDDYAQAIREADGIVVGGGNTWQLVRMLHEHHLMDVVRRRVEEGAPYIGWSAGSNVACPTLKTTNDMPICDPLGFDTFRLIPHQINPHYTELTIQGHGGETREVRINEYLVANPNDYVIGLPEGCILRVEDQRYTLEGINEVKCKIFHHGQEPKWVTQLPF